MPMVAEALPEPDQCRVTHGQAGGRLQGILRSCPFLFWALLVSQGLSAAGMGQVEAGT